jgi:hypothetical protein
MTAKEAIETLRANYPDACYEQLREAVDAAIEALKARDTAGDTISRQAAIDALMEKDKKLRNINWYDKPYAEGECRGINEALSIISNLPSAQPDTRLEKIADLVDGSIDHFDLEDAMDLLYQIKEVLK